uniref:PTMA n=1 Tax=Steinernema glaseri TaxID=37863 RepID=A0A1I7ZC06_9BILA
KDERKTGADDGEEEEEGAKRERTE